LAAAYAANIVAIYQTYRWNSYVEQNRQDPQAWHGLVDNDTWQNGYLAKGSDHLNEILFWLGQHAASGAPPAPPPAPGPVPEGSPARAGTATGPAPRSRPQPGKGGGRGAKTAVAKPKTAKKTPARKQTPARRTKKVSTRKKKTSRAR